MKNYFVLFLFLFFCYNVFAISDEAYNASVSLSVARADIEEVSSRGLSVSRMNESYNEAMQVYLDQVSLEKLNRKTNYKLVFDFTSEVKLIKSQELLAKDELDIFLDEYNSVKDSLNLSEMDEVYNNILKSFAEERFEDTLELIPTGYESLTSIQSSQTALNVFYAATSSTIKKFFYNNWKYISLVLSLLILFWIVFHTPFRRWRIKNQIHSLELRRDSVKKLMQNMQRQYFEAKKISEQEYVVKMKSFDNILLDITRKLLLLKEEINKQEIKSGDRKKRL